MTQQDIKFSKIVVPGIAAAAYLAGDIIGTIFEFPRLVGESVEGYISHVRVIDRGGNGPDLRLYLLPNIPATLPANNAPLVFDADEISVLSFLHHLDIDSVDDFIDCGTFFMANKTKLALPVQGTATLYGILQAQSGVTPAVDDFEIVTWFQRI